MAKPMTLLELHDAIAKAIADAIGHGMREKCERHADAVMTVVGPQLLATAEHAAHAKEAGEGVAPSIERIGWDKECDDVDLIIEKLGMTVEQARTEGGCLHVPRILNHIQETLDALGSATQFGGYMSDKYVAAIHAAARTPAQATQVETWRPMDSAPRDGTMLRLLVQFEDHATEDTTGPAPTIGAYEEGAECWQFAGWCWTHDHFTEGKGTPVGWLPMLGSAPSPEAAHG